MKNKTEALPSISVEWKTKRLCEFESSYVCWHVCFLWVRCDVHAHARMYESVVVSA